MLITVFTPTYNRAALLGRVYESLCEQQFADFEWVIVDDGSTDNTGDVVHTFQEKSGFPIRYFKQANGGKHRAINRGVKEAKGELFFIADSDDKLPSDALQIVAEQFRSIPLNGFAGIVGLDASFEGEIIGTGLPQDTIDSDCVEIRLKYKVVGDLKEVFLTKVMREFPFPEIDGERFCPEALVWGRIAQKYRMRYFNKPIYLAEYQGDGLTHRIVRIRMDSPVASCTHYSELNGYKIQFMQKLKAAINYWRFWYCLKDKAQAPRLAKQWHCVKLLGWMMHKRDVNQQRD